MRPFLLTPKSSVGESWWLTSSRWLYFLTSSFLVTLVANLLTMPLLYIAYTTIPWDAKLEPAFREQLQQTILMREFRRPVEVLLTIGISVIGIFLCFLLMYVPRSCPKWLIDSTLTVDTDSFVSPRHIHWRQRQRHIHRRQRQRLPCQNIHRRQRQRLPRQKRCPI